MGDQLAVLAVDLGVDEDVARHLVVVAVVVRRVLEVPFDLAVGGVERDRAVGEEVVAGTIGAVVARDRIAGTPIGDVGVGVVGAGDIEGAATGLPGIDLVLPGLTARLARGRNGKGFPLGVAGLGIERGDPVAQTAVAAGAADHDRILERKRRGGEFEVGLVAQVLVPYDLAGLLVGRDHASVIASDRNNEIAPQRHAAIAVGLLRGGIHLPDDLPAFAGAHVDLVNHAPAVDHVHKAILDQRGGFERLVAGCAAERDGELQLQILDVRLVDRIERRKALGAEIMMIHEPVLRLGIAQALEGRIGGARGRRAGEQRASKGCESACGVHLHCCLPFLITIIGSNHSPNTNTIVALPCPRSSGIRFSRCRPLRNCPGAAPPQQRPEAMAMYCLPLTE